MLSVIRRPKWTGAASILAMAAMIAGISPPAFGQNTDADARIRKMESEIKALQRKVFPGGDEKYFEPQITGGTGWSWHAGGIAVKVDQRLLPSRFMVREGTHDVPLSAYGEGCLPISRAFCSGERETVTVRTAAGFVDAPDLGSSIAEPPQAAVSRSMIALPSTPQRLASVPTVPSPVAVPL